MTPNTGPFALWMSALQSSESIDTFLLREATKDLPHPWRSFLEKHQAILCQGDDWWPAWRIMLQLALESSDEVCSDAALEWLTGHEDVAPTTLVHLKTPSRPTSSLRHRSFGGEQPIRAASWGPTTSQIVTAQGRNVQIWDTSTGTAQAFFEQSKSIVEWCTALPNGWLFNQSAHDEVTVRLFEKPNVPVGTIKHFAEPVGAVVFDAQHVLLWNTAELVRLNIQDGRLRAEHCMHQVSMSADLAQGPPFTHNGNGLLVTWSENTLYLGHIQTPQEVNTLAGNWGEIRRAAFTNPSRFALWTEQGTLVFLKIEATSATPTQTWPHEAHDAVVLPEGRLMAWNRMNAVSIWNHDGLCEHRDGSRSTRIIDAVALDNDQVITLEGSPYSGTMHLWDTHNREAPMVLGATQATRLSPWGDGLVVAWDESGLELGVWSSQGCLGQSELQSITKSVNTTNPKEFLTVSNDGLARTWHMSPGTMSNHLPQPERWQALGAVGSSSGTLWSGNGYGEVVGTCLESGKLHMRIDAHQSAVMGLELTDDQTRILSWASDGQARVWCTETGRLLSTRHKPQENPGQTTLWDGQWALSWTTVDDSSGIKAILELWSLENGHILHTLKGQTQAVAAGFPLDTEHFVTHGATEVCLWSRRNATLHKQILHTQRLTSVQPMADGYWLMCDTSHTLSFWNGTALHHTLKVRALRQAVVSSSGQHVILWGPNTLRLWCNLTQRLHPMPKPNAPVLDVVPLPKERTAIVTTKGLHLVSLNKLDAWQWSYQGPRSINRRAALFGPHAIGVAERNRLFVLDLQTGICKGGWQSTDQLNPITPPQLKVHAVGPMNTKPFVLAAL